MLCVSDNGALLWFPIVAKDTLPFGYFFSTYDDLCQFFIQRVFRISPLSLLDTITQSKSTFDHFRSGYPFVIGIRHG